MLNMIILLLSYFIGSIPFALVIGKSFYNTDIRGYGSGNLGATNSFRILGKTAGTIVAFADLLKGIIACVLPDGAAFERFTCTMRLTCDNWPRLSCFRRI